jgi:hypothetical protein
LRNESYRPGGASHPPVSERITPQLLARIEETKRGRRLRAQTVNDLITMHNENFRKRMDAAGVTLGDPRNTHIIKGCNRTGSGAVISKFDVVVIEGNIHTDDTLLDYHTEDIASFRKGRVDDPDSVMIGICHDECGEDIIGKVVVGGLSLVKVYRAATGPGTETALDDTTANFVAADGVSALKVGEAGHTLLWEETVEDNTVPHLGLVHLGAKIAGSVTARWAAYEGA